MNPAATLSALAVAAGVLMSSAMGQATVVEKVVAIVGERAIWLSDLRARAKPFVAQVAASAPAGAQRAAALSQVYSTVLERMVDEELELRAAAQQNISVSAEEIDAAVARVAKGNGVEVNDLLKEIDAAGVPRAQYREELRRQLLDAKLMETRLQGRIRVSEDDMRSTYDGLVADERKQLPFRIAWIRVNAASSAVSDVEKAGVLAEKVAASARREDFAALARQYSADTSSREAGGLLPPMKPGDLPADIEKVVTKMEVGEVSPAFRHQSSYVIVKLVEREESQLPEFNEALQQLQGRVYMEKMERARRSWLDGLRKRTHVDIRW